MTEWVGEVSDPKSGPQVSTTVDRAGALLQLLAQHSEGLGITVLTRHLNTQRAPLYRILEALIKHGLVRRDPQKRYLLGVGTLGLARAYAAQLPSGLDPLLQALADETGMSASINAVDGEQVTVVASRTPARQGEYVFTPAGFRHPIPPASIRAAIAALQPASETDSDGVREARSLGYAVGRGTIVPGRHGVSAVVPGSDLSGSMMLVTLASVGEFDHETVAEPLLGTAQAIGLSIR